MAIDKGKESPKKSKSGGSLVLADDQTNTPLNILKKIGNISKEDATKNNGIYNGNFPEPVPDYNAAESEKVIKGANNTWIILGRDRPRGLASGYGGLGQSHAGTIDIIAGMSGRLTRKVDPETNEPVTTDKSPELDAARIYLSQKTAADMNFHIRPGKVGSPSPRSAIVLKADGVRLVARDGIKLVTGTDTVNSQGVGIGTFQGIDLMAGNREAELQPLVKGENMKKCVEAIMSDMKALSDIVIQMNKELATYKMVLAAHTHPIVTGSPLTGPSAEILGKTVSSVIPDMMKFVTDILQWQKGILLTQAHYVKLPNGAGYICSPYNHTN